MEDSGRNHHKIQKERLQNTRKRDERPEISENMIRLVDATEEGRGEIGPKIEQCMAGVKAYVIMEAQKRYPSELIDEWLSRLQGSSCDVCAGQPKTEDTEETRFIAGLPRDQKWSRVTLISNLPAEKLKQLADETNLTVKPEKDTHLIVYGKAKDIKQFIKNDRISIQRNSTITKAEKTAWIINPELADWRFNRVPETLSH